MTPLLLSGLPHACFAHHIDGDDKDCHHNADEPCRRAERFYTQNASAEGDKGKLESKN